MAAAMTIGTAAESATVEKFDLQLRYDGTSFHDVAFANIADDEDSGTYLGDIHSSDAPYWLKSQRFTDLKTGDLISFVATIVYGETDIPDGEYSNGGSAPTCSFGPADCTRIDYAWKRPDGHLQFGMDFLEDFSGRATAGSTFTYNLFIDDMFFSDEGEYVYDYRSESSSFTVVQPAPVPVPASVALLPLGIGALAMMRKRRRKVS